MRTAFVVSMGTGRSAADGGRDRGLALHPALARRSMGDRDSRRGVGMALWSAGRHPERNSNEVPEAPGGAEATRLKSAGLIYPRWARPITVLARRIHFGAVPRPRVDANQRYGKACLNFQRLARSFVRNVPPAVTRSRISKNASWFSRSETAR